MKIYNCNCLISRVSGLPGLSRLPLEFNKNYWFKKPHKTEQAVTHVYAKVEDRDQFCYGYISNESL